MPAGNVTPQAFAVSVLNGLKAPVTTANVKALVGWANAEGGHWNNSARYNPLNTTQSAPGASSINSVGVKSYTNWNEGIQATLQTLRNGRYGGILNALRAGNNPGAVASAIGASPWGTSGATVAQTIAAANGSIPKGTISSLGAPTPNTTPKLATTPGQTIATTTQVPDQAAFQAAQARAIAGSYLAKQTDPYAAGQPKTGLSKGTTGNPLLSSGLLSTTAPNPADYVKAQTSLQQIAGTSLASHPAGNQKAVMGQALNDASKAGVSGAAAKLLRMVSAVIGGPYSQANHAGAINQGEGAVKRLGTDCSGLISWLMGPQGLGIWHTALATPDIPHAPGLQSGQGQVITLWNNANPGNSGHVFIKIGNQFFASEGGAGIRQLPQSEVNMYLTQGSDGGHYQAFHPRGL